MVSCKLTFTSVSHSYQKNPSWHEEFIDIMFLSCQTKGIFLYCMLHFEKSYSIQILFFSAFALLPRATSRRISTWISKSKARNTGLHGTNFWESRFQCKKSGRACLHAPRCICFPHKISVKATFFSLYANNNYECFYFHFCSLKKSS